MRPLPGIGEETPEPNEEETIKDVTKIMRAAATFTSALGPLRVPHVKSHGCVDATFTVNDDLPAEYAVGIFRKDEHGKGRSYSARIRFSNASSKQQDDSEGDGRGMAIKVFVPGNPPKEQDFLLATEKVFFARNGEDFLAFVKALTIFNGRE